MNMVKMLKLPYTCDIIFYVYNMTLFLFPEISHSCRQPLNKVLVYISSWQQKFEFSMYSKCNHNNSMVINFPITHFGSKFEYSLSTNHLNPFHPNCYREHVNIVYQIWIIHTESNIDEARYPRWFVVSKLFAGFKCLWVWLYKLYIFWN